MSDMNTGASAPQDERALFEQAWMARGMGKPSRCTEPAYTHEYAEPIAQNGWVMWQAARAALPAQAVAPDLRTLIDDYGRACRRDGNPAWESAEGVALAAALAAPVQDVAPIQADNWLADFPHVCRQYDWEALYASRYGVPRAEAHEAWEHTCAKIEARKAVAKDVAPSDARAVPSSNDGKEQDAFEEWAKGERMDMTKHPLHWLFLDAKTYAARQGWKGALEYVGRVLAAAPAAPQAVPDDSDAYINELVQQHGYGHPLAIAARLEQWISRYGAQDSGTLVMGESMIALRALAARPAAQPADAQQEYTPVAFVTREEKYDVRGACLCKEGLELPTGTGLYAKTSELEAANAAARTQEGAAS